ncbi:MAG: pentapeptide repeat-containing protein [Cyanothece sp. SIO2G6]|nr:pentapeptide repeat-containing protein [Cyanothece sp. SIO2G6]
MASLNITAEELLERYAAGERNFAGVKIIGIKYRYTNKREYIHPDLSGVNLSGANLSKVSLCNINLERANLEGANLSNSGLSGTRLVRTNLRGANLQRAGLEFADFSALQDLVCSANIKLPTYETS